MYKKIVILSWFFYPKIGGAESIALNHASYLVKNGYEVTVITAKVANAEKDQELHQGIKIVRCSHFNKALNDMEQAELLKQWLERELPKLNPDIVHAHNFTYIHGPERSKAAFAVCRALNVPIIEHCHNAQQRKPEVTKELVNLDWDKIVAVSNYAREALIGQGCKPDKIEVVYNCVDGAIFDPNAVEFLQIYDNAMLSSKIKLLFPARIFTTDGGINPHKPILPVLTSLRQIKKNGFKDFVLIFTNNKTVNPEKDSTNQLKMSELFAEYGLQDNYLMVPEVDTLLMPRLYKGCDYVLAPFPNESFGLVFVEAMLMHKPPFAPNSGGAKEIIEDQKSGFLLNNYSDDLSLILQKIVSGELNIEKIKVFARKYAINKFSVDKFGHELEKVYAEVVGEK